ncbi:MAG: PucR family transcriptional regulator [Gulosibacter sp.]|uniref:PucR family transcriptional regulator n=1 Tax=Gulosibacter sp. TaxID=2817531 RepID=UPI003F93D721
MPISIAELVRDPELGLRIRVGHGSVLNDRLDWAATTEMPDPGPFLTGGELVLTTGMRLRSVRACRNFVRAVAAAGSRGIGFGSGFTHEQIPEALLDEARRAGIPVLEVPVQVSFALVVKRVAYANASDRVEKVEAQYRRRERLVALLMGDGGLESMLATLGRETGAHVAVSVNGELISGSLEIDDPQITGWDALPIALGPAGQATLHVSRPRNDDELLTTSRTLVGLHLAQTARRRRDAREQAGQVIGDLIAGRLAPEVVTPRLESIGLEPGGTFRMLVVTGTGQRRADLAAMQLPSSLRDTVATVLDDRLTVLLDARDVAPQVAAEALIVATRAAGIPARVGIGGPYPATSALRWSWYEALDALDRLATDEVIGEAPRLSIAALILGAADAPIADLAEELLGPLERHDREHGTQLVATLDAFLANSGAANEVAQVLGTHRNTVRYRIDQVASITGLDPRITADAVQLSLARAARRLTEG